MRETVAAMDHSTLQQLCQAGGVAGGGKLADLRRALERHICGQAWALEAETLCFWDAWGCTEVIYGVGCRLKCYWVNVVTSANDKILCQIVVCLWGKAHMGSAYDFNLLMYFLALRIGTPCLPVISLWVFPLYSQR